MSFLIYAVNNEIRLNVGSIRQLSDMSKWLQTKGNKEYMYELWKTSLHSKWIWKEYRNGWGRMATPSTKRNIDIVDTYSIEQKSVEQKTRINKNKSRQTRGQSHR